MHATSRAGSTLIFAALAVMIALIAWADYLTGDRLGFALFYFLPLAISAWFLPKPHRYGLVGMAILSGYVAESQLAGHTAYDAITVWNTAIRAIMFLLMTWLFEKTRTQVDMEKRAKQELADRNTFLENFNRRKDEYLAACSHDLRSPLISVVAGCKVLLSRRSGALDDKQAEIVGACRTHAEDVVKLVDSILDLARIETGHEELVLETFEVPALLQECVAAHEDQAAQSGVAVNRDVPPGMPMVTADRIKVKRIFNNLLSNALKYCGGRDVKVVLSSSGVTWSLAVTDMGPGMGPEQLETLFERFSEGARRKRSRQEGTGLGLYITRGLTELHGGRIEVRSKLGEGSTFQVTMPMATAASATD